MDASYTSCAAAKSPTVQPTLLNRVISSSDALPVTFPCASSARVPTIYSRVAQIDIGDIMLMALQGVRLAILFHKA